MPIENLSNGLLKEDLFNQLSSLTRLFQAIGGLIILYVVFNITNTIINKKKNKQIEQLAKDVKEIKKILKQKK